jgi:Protein of unknown function (DUF2948)
MTTLRLAALDADDLTVLSAHLQDAILTSADLVYQPKQRLVALMVNRFDWLDSASATQSRGRKPSLVRRKAMVRIERVERARTKNLAVSEAQTVLSLLAMTFEAGAEPGGTVVLTFSGGAEMRLDVECIEIMLTDLGPSWSTPSQPTHPDDVSSERAGAGQKSGASHPKDGT